MKLPWLVLLVPQVLLLRSEAEHVTRVQVQLGSNAILNCSQEANNMYWYMQIHSQFRVPILRGFTSATNDAEYYTPDLKSKFSLSLKNSLVIKNVTKEDCRIYYCGEKDTEDTFHLISGAINDSDQQQQTDVKVWQSEPIILTSFTLNGLSLILIGLVVSHLCKKRGHTSQQNTPSPLTSEFPEILTSPQYEEIQLPSSRAPPPSTQERECIYYKAELPQHIRLQDFNAPVP
ncbi:uncharacterized protein LOC143012663 isoform X2 [Genypterus blacodes]|uniref:uncharacterized protein LOC143012663 isoform X2 n=1 Tax=Genypterus blacodes TaxID=154954 RepID=UPI003F761156